MAMKLQARKMLAVGEGEYEILFDTGVGSLLVRCRILDTSGKLQVRFDKTIAEAATVDSAEMQRAVFSFHHARTAQYNPPKRPVRNIPPWFNPTPLKLSEIEAISDLEYELRFTEPDGEVKTMSGRVISLNRGDSSFLGVDVIGHQELTARIYPRDVNAAILDFHVAVHPKNQPD